MSYSDNDEPRRNEATIFAQRPAASDASAGKLFLRHSIITTPVIITCLSLLGQWGTGLDAMLAIVGITIVLETLGLAAFGGDFFGWRFSVALRWHRVMPALHDIEFFTWAKYPDVMGSRSANGRRIVLFKSIRVTTLPTTIHGNFRQFLRQLHSAKTPFSFQVLHIPSG